MGNLGTAQLRKEPKSFIRNILHVNPRVSRFRENQSRSREGNYFGINILNGSYQNFPPSRKAAKECSIRRSRGSIQQQKKARKGERTAVGAAKQR